MVKINFEDLKINSIKSSSGIFSGTNYQVRWKHVRKSAEGFGRISGDKNTVKNGRNVIYRKR